MLEPNKGEMEGLHISFELTPQQRAILSSAVQQEWFDIMQKLMEEELRKLNVRLINTPGEDEKSIIANHRLAKGAAMFYVGFFQRLSEELQLHKYNAQNLGTPQNPEQGPALDIGGEHVGD